MKVARLTVMVLAGWLALAVSANDARAQQPAPSKADIEAAKKHYSRARDYQDAGKYDEAATEYLAAYELYPDAEFLFNVGEVYRLKGNKRRAVEYFEKYLALDPNGRGSADARASVATLKKAIAAEEAEVARKRAADEAAARQTEHEDTTETTSESSAGESTQGESTAAPVEAVYPREDVLRPLQLPKGRLEAVADIQVFTELNNNWDQTVASWIGLAPAARYGVTDKIQVSGKALLLPVKPSSNDFEDAHFFGGLLVGGHYLLHELISARLDVGLGLRGRLMSNPYAPPRYPEPLYANWTFGLRAGVSVKKSLAGRIAVTLEPRVVVQLDSTKDEDAGCAADDEDCVTTAAALHLPLALHYQVIPALALGIRTGIFTGSAWQTAAEEGATYPLLAEGLFTLPGDAIDAGLLLGFSTLAPTGEDNGLGDTFYIGLHAAWRNR